MTIRIQNTLTRQKEVFEPLEPGRVRMYSCGPTVYSDAHIGHMMGPVVFDTVARWLRARGHEVQFVHNITDIEDKIIKRAQETGQPWQDITERYTAEYFRLLEELRVVTITDTPRCTEYVDQMIGFIQQLIDEDRAYVAGDGVYYDVQRQEGYGKLSGRRVEDMQAGARIEAAGDLRHPADFALWKLAKPGEPTWESPWGSGRPGWHIECSVMSSELLGGAFDIHGGGDDLKFPHHENEIAQSEAHGDDFARTWMHHGLIQYESRKVAKSDPRMADPEFSQQFDARWLVDHYGAAAVRFFILRSPYRRPVDFAPDALAAARTGLVRMLKQLGEHLDVDTQASIAEIEAREVGQELGKHRAHFIESMDDDFNTGEAIAALFSIVSAARSSEGPERDTALLLARDLARLLGLCQAGDLGRVGMADADENLQRVLEALLLLRADARERKDFATSDAIRDLLVHNGVQVLDDASGSRADAGSAAEDALDAILAAVLELRASARAARDFATADGVRDRLAESGVVLHDAAGGSSWSLEG